MKKILTMFLAMAACATTNAQKSEKVESTEETYQKDVTVIDTVAAEAQWKTVLEQYEAIYPIYKEICDAEWKFDFKHEGITNNDVVIKALVSVAQLATNNKPVEQLTKEEKKMLKNAHKGWVVGELLQTFNTYAKDFSNKIDSMQKTYTGEEHNVRGDLARRGWRGLPSYPRKTVTITVQNEYYRPNIVKNFSSNAYSNRLKLDKLDDYEQSKDWEWIQESGLNEDWGEVGHKDFKYVSKSFPTEVSYYTNAKYPDYTFYDQDVYDKEGKLVRRHNLLRESGEYRDLEDLILNTLCGKDYLANKYGIKKYPASTQRFVQMKLGLYDKAKEKALGLAGAAKIQAAQAQMQKARNNAERYAAQQAMAKVQQELTAAFIDQAGMQYVDQLKKDHSRELGHVYRIERVSGTQFKVYLWDNDPTVISNVILVTYGQDKAYRSELASVKVVSE